MFIYIGFIWLLHPNVCNFFLHNNSYEKVHFRKKCVRYEKPVFNFAPRYVRSVLTVSCRAPRCTHKPRFVAAHAKTTVLFRYLLIHCYHPPGVCSVVRRVHLMLPSLAVRRLLLSSSTCAEWDDLVPPTGRG